MIPYQILPNSQLIVGGGGWKIHQARVCHCTLRKREPFQLDRFQNPTKQNQRKFQIPDCDTDLFSLRLQLVVAINFIVISFGGGGGGGTEP